MKPAYSKKMIAFALAILTFLFAFSFVAAAGPDELSGHWVQRIMEDWIRRRLITGFPDGTYKPDKTLTRSEFIALVNRLCSFGNTAQVRFTDVQGNKWLSGEVSKAAAAGYISGYSDNTFRPYKEISRLDAAVAISKIMKIDTLKTADKTCQFKDAARIPKSAWNAVNAVVAKGYMVGTPDKYFYPEKPLTRAEMVALLDRSIGPDGLMPLANYSGKVGNTAANLASEGNRIIKGGYIYTSGYGIEKRYLSTGNYAADITFGSSGLMNVTDQYVFYVQASENSIWRANLDGSGTKCLYNKDAVDYMIVYGNYIFFSSPKNGGGIYRMNLDGSGRLKLGEYGKNLSVTADSVYYKRIEDDRGNGRVYRMNKDGTNRRMISASSVDNFVTWGSSIYFTEAISRNLYRMNLDGTSVTAMNDDESYHLNIAGNTIYYSNADDGYKMYKIKTNGTGRSRVNDSHSVSITITGGRIYFYNSEDGWDYILLPPENNEIEKTYKNQYGNVSRNIQNGAFILENGGYLYLADRTNAETYRFKTDGTGRRMIHDRPMHNMNIQGDWIYYSYTTDETSRYSSTTGFIYRIKKDGSSGPVELARYNILEMVVYGDWIYSTINVHDSDMIGGGLLYKVRTDGTGGSFIERGHSDYGKNLAVAEDWIYYVNTKDNHRLYKIRTNGTGRTKLTDYAVAEVSIAADSIYFTKPIEKTPYGDIMKMNLDGSNMTALNGQMGKSLYIVDNRFLYVENGTLYSSSMDGAEKKVLLSDIREPLYYNDPLPINLSGDYLYQYEDVYGVYKTQPASLFEYPQTGEDGYHYKIVKRYKVR